jgi:D-alanyl-D-alanine-carboxypeptidase/D-alanyl-D-alanine-endopeptidase
VRNISFFALLLICSISHAALPDAFRQHVEQDVQSGAYHDLAVGWIDGSDRATALYGNATADSLFEIGATTELFTDLLLARAVLEGRVRLQSSLRDLLPDLNFGDPAVGALTLEALATHRTGLPSLPANLMPEQEGDLFAGYGEANLRALLANHELTTTQPDYVYSVLDVGVLGYALGRSYGTDLDVALQEKVFGPLHLKRATFSDSGALTGFSRGAPAGHWHFGALAGSAGLRTSLSDLLDFMQVNLRPEDSPLRAALLIMRQPRVHAASEQFGLGWNIVEVRSGDQTWPLLWRGSSTGGFSTFVGFRTDRQQAAVLLANTDTDLSALGMTLLDDRPLPPSVHVATPASAGDLGVYEGLYQVRNGVEITVRQRDGHLVVQRRGDAAVRLNGVAEDVFDGGVNGISLSFQREAGKVTSLLIARGGVNFLAQRLSERAPRIARAKFDIDVKQFDEFVGDYAVDRASQARVARASDGLTLQLTGHARVALAPFAKDRFACIDESCELNFVRDKGGHVVGATIDLAGGQHNVSRLRWNKP